MRSGSIISLTVAVKSRLRPPIRLDLRWSNKSLISSYIVFFDGKLPQLLVTRGGHGEGRGDSREGEDERTKERKMGREGDTESH
jgi:hypothetical protein